MLIIVCGPGLVNLDRWLLRCAYEIPKRVHKWNASSFCNDIVFIYGKNKIFIFYGTTFEVTTTSSFGNGIHLDD